MGVPALFRWLTRKYPKITSKVIEEMPINMGHGKEIPVDITKANPNGIEFDNLYLDMNGIVHPCTHPEDRPPPKTEDEAMILIFEYIDRIVGMVRPRKLLYMAIDGVAPRAKMNQQRSRRFRAALDLQMKTEEETEIRKKLLADGIPVNQKDESPKFDSNCITPGTPFMLRLAECLRFYVEERLNNHPGWKNLKIILSDASVPGEGEHKIMDFIRNQRLLPKYNPNTRHVIYGLDADLIMLALATHEPHFYVLREDVFASPPGRETKCFVCSKPGHKPEDCQGIIPHDETEKKKPAPLKPFVFLHVPILREYLEHEMRMDNLLFGFDLERVLDDWVFMCFFVGNDFLPHLPSLEIREGAIDMLIEVYKRKLPQLNSGYLTQSGTVNLELVQAMMEEVGEREDEIFRRRRENEQRRNANYKRQKQEEEAVEKQREIMPANTRVKKADIQSQIANWGSIAVAVNKPKDFQSTNKAFAESKEELRKQANESAADILRRGLKRKRGGESDSEQPEASSSSGEKAVDEESKSVEEDGSQEDDDELADEVRLWEPGWKQRYYQTKFSIEMANMEFRKKIVHAYTEGLCWAVLLGNGIIHITMPHSLQISPKEMRIKFDKGTPFKPLEQLMGVLPAASRSHIPNVFHDLMTDPESEIIDFYPERFEIDLNGKKYAWQGVALLPFIEESRLLKSMQDKYNQLDDSAQMLNKSGTDLLFVSRHHPLFESLCHLYTHTTTKETPLNLQLSDRLGGFVAPSNEATMPGSTLYSPLADYGLPDQPDNQSICSQYHNPRPPKPDYEYPAKLLPGVKLGPRLLTSDDLFQLQRRSSRGGRERREGRYRDDVNDRYAQSGGYSNNNQRTFNNAGNERHRQRVQQHSYNNNSNQSSYSYQQQGSYPPNYAWQRNFHRQNF